MFVNDQESARRRRGAAPRRPETSCTSGWIAPAVAIRTAPVRRCPATSRSSSKTPSSSSSTSPPGCCQRAAGAQERGAVRVRSGRAASASVRQATPARRASHRPGHVGPRCLRQGRRFADAIEGAVQAAPARARLPHAGLRPPRPAVGPVARSPRVGREGADPEADASARSGGAGSDQRLPDPSSASRTRRWSRCGCRAAAGIRSASRRGCAGTRWSARSATRSARMCCARSSSSGTRCTPGAWRSTIRRTAARAVRGAAARRLRRADRATAPRAPAR